MSTISPEARVAGLVLEQPSRARVFERYGIDYCCHGETPLDAACAERGIDLSEVLAALDEPGPAGAEDVDWRDVPTPALVEHIVGEHHAYLREELEPLGALVEKVARVHGEAHPELADVRDTYASVAAELERHMGEEEASLFPAFIALDERANEPLSEAFEASLASAFHDHDDVGAGLARLRELTGSYAPPADACNSYRAMLGRLEALEADTHRHVHEENNVLFPRARELELAR